LGFGISNLKAPTHKALIPNRNRSRKDSKFKRIETFAPVLSLFGVLAQITRK
jgi:hypothetical protein